MTVRVLPGFHSVMPGLTGHQRHPRLDNVTPDLIGGLIPIVLKSQCVSEKSISVLPPQFQKF